MNTENAQAGAVAVLHRNDAGQIYWTTSVPLPELPLGVYVPVEALEGLVDELDQLAADIARAGIAGFGNRALAIRDELTQLIKERSNGAP